MAYTSNPYVGKTRMRARNDVVWGRLTVSQAALRYGVHRTTVWRWIQKAKRLGLNGNCHIETLSSGSPNQPNRLPRKTVKRVIKLRLQTGRCALVLHHLLNKQGIQVSLSSVKRILKRHKLTRKKKRKIKDGTRFRRPDVTQPGSLVQVDTIHYVNSDYSRSYIYVLVDLYTRMAYAKFTPIISPTTSIEVMNQAQKQFPFKFDVVQTDNGQEFGQRFLHQLKRKQIKLRHSRVRKPNDNAHVERLNRTIQEECFKGMNPTPTTANKKLKAYIDFYNYHRPHLGIQCKTPIQMLHSS